jgi:hypothetical protein
MDGGILELHTNDVRTLSIIYQFNFPMPPHPMAQFPRVVAKLKNIARIKQNK